MSKSDGATEFDEKTSRRIAEMKLTNLFFNENFISTRDQIPISELKIFRIALNTEQTASLEETVTMESLSKNPNTDQAYQILPVDYTQTEIRKNVIGVLSAEATKENLKNLHEIIQTSSVYTLLFVQEKVREDGEEKITVIRPPNVGADYKDKIWILGNLKSGTN